MRNALRVFAVVIGVALLIGCDAPSQPAASMQDGTAPAANASAGESTVLVSLKAADAVDGAEDKVIGKCYVCGLGMDGSQEHSTEFEGYTCYLCSEHCKEHFAANAESVIAATPIPSSK